MRCAICEKRLNHLPYHIFVNKDDGKKLEKIDICSSCYEKMCDYIKGGSK